MNQIDMIKAFAKLEGVELMPLFCKQLWYKVDGKDRPYNPITDLALNCAARDKYGVSVEYNFNRLTGHTSNYVDINSGSQVRRYVSWGDKADIPKAVISCILLANGVWVDG